MCKMVFKLKKNFCVMIFISFCLGAGLGAITKAPRNVVALVGNTATLECCNGLNHSLQWSRVSFSTVDTSDIYLGKSGGFVDKFRDGRFIISNGNSSGCDNLIISDIQLTDAGAYTCADEYNAEYSASAEVTVLDSFACHEVFPKDVYMGINEFKLEPDVIQLMCSIKYRGGFIPEMQWKWQKSSKVSNPKAIVIHSNETFTSTSIVTTVASEEFDRSTVMCFAKNPGDEDLSRNTVNWTSKLYRVNYALFSRKEVVNCTKKEVNLNCNPNCSISLARDSKFCEISFANETSSKEYVALTIPKDPCWIFKVLVIICAVLIGALTVVIGILIYRLRKIQHSQKRSNASLDPNDKELFPICTRLFRPSGQPRGILKDETAAASDSSNSKHRQDGISEEKQPLSITKTSLT